MLCMLWFPLTDFLFCRCRVRVHSVVLEGTFGRVYRGTYTEEDGVEEEVLVKTVTGRSQLGCSYGSLYFVLDFSEQNRVADAGVGVGKYLLWYLPVLSALIFFISCYQITVKHAEYQFLPIYSYSRRGVLMGGRAIGAAFPGVKSRRGGKASYSWIL